MPGFWLIIPLEPSIGDGNFWHDPWMWTWHLPCLVWHIVHFQTLNQSLHVWSLGSILVVLCPGSVGMPYPIMKTKLISRKKIPVMKINWFLINRVEIFEFFCFCVKLIHFHTVLYHSVEISGLFSFSDFTINFGEWISSKNAIFEIWGGQNERFEQI